MNDGQAINFVVTSLLLSIAYEYIITDKKCPPILEFFSNPPEHDSFVNIANRPKMILECFRGCRVLDACDWLILSVRSVVAVGCRGSARLRSTPKAEFTVDAGCGTESVTVLASISVYPDIYTDILASTVTLPVPHPASTVLSALLCYYRLQTG